MKYFLLKKITEYLQKDAQNIKYIKRIDNNIIIIEFNNKNILYFDMAKNNSMIFKSKNIISSKKDFNAPFDIALQKRFNNSNIENIELYNDDKIINIRVNSSSSYKKQTTILQLEFTGKHTNIIVLDENRVIIEALRHIDEFSSSRVVKVGIKLDEVPKQTFIPKMEEVENIEETLYELFEEKERQNLENIKKQLNEYLNGDRKRFDTTLLMVGTDFQKSVWNALLKIPYGVTSTYLQLAKDINNEKAVRAVASANGANAISLIIPCHRIIGSDGELIGYGGGLPVKKRLLKLERSTSALSGDE